MIEDNRPVEDWTTDFDIFDPDYLKEPMPVWDDLRRRCPIAHSTRWGGAWMATRYEDLQALVRMVPELSSSSPAVVPQSTVWPRGRVRGWVRGIEPRDGIRGANEIRPPDRPPGRSRPLGRPPSALRPRRFPILDKL